MLAVTIAPRRVYTTLQRRTPLQAASSLLFNFGQSANTTIFKEKKKKG